MRLGCILLASGFGRRFGSNKLLAHTGGAPLYALAMDRLVPLPFERVAVTSRYDEILDAALLRGFIALPNPNAQEGMAAGIRLGMSAMDGLDAVLFTVCDQPWLTSDSIRRLLVAAELHPGKICALSWNGRRGNPVLFPAVFFPELSALTGDTGGGAVIKRHLDRLLLVEASDPRELADVDEPGDLEFP